MRTDLNEQVHQLLKKQQYSWPLACQNYQALQQVQVKEITVKGQTYRVQFNPARMVSSGANVDAQAIQKRPCFLCSHHRPKEQQGIPYLGKYHLLVNPFPIFPEHLTVTEMCHVEQHINGRFGDLLTAARELPDFTLFYNGPRCGASAPDHLHFQAGSQGVMPIEKNWQKHIAYEVTRIGKAILWRLKDAIRTTWVLESSVQTDAEQLFRQLCQVLPMKDHDYEPMMNLLAYYEEKRWVSFIFPRNQHRPSCYNAEGDARLLCSPASVDLGGVFILPREEDFRKITADLIIQILQEVCLPPVALDEAENRLRQQTEPTVQVGILTAPHLNFQFLTPYTCQKKEYEGKQFVTCQNGQIAWQGQLYDELLFEPTCETAAFELEQVTIGLNFHWERQENQRFPGALKIIVQHDRLTAINLVRVEDYLTSVISSEMNATASSALLKAHAVISRSWLLAQLQQKQHTPTTHAAWVENKDERIRWYNHEDHNLFDVCADDHCQRYQGITRASTPQVRQAIEETRGEVLMYQNTLCDARFSKCCGGAFEEFSTCWEDRNYAYLHRQRDYQTDKTLPDLTREEDAERWIRSTPDAFCHTTDPQILQQVLNRYDQETTDFYRWQVSYTQEELATLIHQRSGLDFGQIIDLQPVARGTSGRLWKLRIVGTRRTLILGKELEIRRTLSPSHLYSSAFVIDREDFSPEGIPARFVLTGAGWGHGVGLCQIGAAVMSEQGHSYQDILTHYYAGAHLEKLY